MAFWSLIRNSSHAKPQILSMIPLILQLSHCQNKQHIGYSCVLPGFLGSIRCSLVLFWITGLCTDPKEILLRFQINYAGFLLITSDISVPTNQHHHFILSFHFNNACILTNQSLFVSINCPTIMGY